MEFHVIPGDVLDVLPGLYGAEFDAVLCDPPYGLKFMGKAWDHGVPGEPVWRMVLDALKPGAHLLAFGGTRTEHRLCCAIEDAGFEIRDKVMWLYGQGFPKSMAIDKAIDKAAGETDRPIIGEKLGADRLRNQAKGGERDGDGRWGNEVGRDPYLRGPVTDLAKRFHGWGTALKPAWEPCVVAMKPLDGTNAANAAAHGVAGLNIDGCKIEYQSEDDKASATPQGRVTSKNSGSIAATPDAGRCESRIEFDRPKQNGRWPANLILDAEAGAMLGEPSRYFYCSKVTTRERNTGLSDGMKNGHPTLKPIDLCRYLATLILPPPRDTPRRLLVPFSGSGSEMIGALLAGWDEVYGIEMDPEYCDIAERRVAHWTNNVA